MQLNSSETGDSQCPLSSPLSFSLFFCLSLKAIFRNCSVANKSSQTHALSLTHIYILVLLSLRTLIGKMNYPAPYPNPYPNTNLNPTLTQRENQVLTHKQPYKVVRTSKDENEYFGTKYVASHTHTHTSPSDQEGLFKLITRLDHELMHKWCNSGFFCTMCLFWFFFKLLQIMLIIN